MVSKEDLELFFSEADDLIEKIEDSILNLEENPEDLTPIQELFFAFHSFKGLTGMVGLDNLSKYCHHIETFLDRYKKDPKIGRKRQFITNLFESLDIIHKTLNSVKTGAIDDLDSQLLNEIVETFDNVDTEYEITFVRAPALEELEKLKDDKNNHFYNIYIRIVETCIFKKVRLFIIFRALNKIGKICSSEPDPNLLEKRLFEYDFTVYFLSRKTSTEITNTLNEILEIESKVINKTSPEEVIKKVSEFRSKRVQKREKPIYFEDDHDIIIPEEEVEEDIANISTVVQEFSDITGQITSIKVNIDVIEKLMNLFGEVVVLKNKLNQFLKEKQDWEITGLFDNMDKLFLEIQEIIFKLKLVKVESTFRRYRRLVRDISDETDKQVKFILEGTSVEIDRKILEELNSPLIHLLRNAIYHGIESPQRRSFKGKNPTGILKLKTYRRAGSIYIEVSDDGAGINYDKIRQKIIERKNYSPEEVSQLSEEKLIKFLLLPGFSTLTEADLISGRGMGLAIATEKVKELGGSLDIASVKNQGTSFTLNVPFSRVILKAQLFKIAGDLFAIPIENISKIFFFDRELVEYIRGEEHYRIESKLVPVIRLDYFLEFVGYKSFGEKEDEIGSNSHSKIGIMVEKDEQGSAIFIIDEILQQMEVVIKPFRSKYSGLKEILGVSITGDGSICLVIDAVNIIRSQTKDWKTFELMEEAIE